MTAVRPVPISSVEAELAKLIVPELMWMFAEAPLVTGENRQNYLSLALYFARAIRPRDGVECFTVKRMTDLAWNQVRLRGVIAALIDSGRRNALEEVMNAQFDKLTGPWSHSSTATGWTKGDKKAVAEVERFLKDRGLTLNAVIAEAVRARLPDLEKLEALLTQNNQAEVANLREIDRRRVAVAEQKELLVEGTAIVEAVAAPRGLSLRDAS